MEKIEGLAITAHGKILVFTDNDGVDDSSGETFFWSIGKIRQACILYELGEDPKRKILGVPLQFKLSEIAVRRAVRIESFDLHSQRKIHLHKNRFDFI